MVIAAARSNRQIEAMALVLWCIKKNPVIAGKAILGPIYNPTQVKNTYFCHFWEAILLDPVTVRTRFCLNLKFFLHFKGNYENFNRTMSKMPSGGRSLPSTK